MAPSPRLAAFTRFLAILLTLLDPRLALLGSHCSTLFSRRNRRTRGRSGSGLDCTQNCWWQWRQTRRLRRRWARLIWQWRGHGPERRWRREWPTNHLWLACTVVRKRWWGRWRWWPGIWRWRTLARARPRCGAGEGDGEIRWVPFAACNTPIGVITESGRFRSHTAFMSGTLLGLLRARQMGSRCKQQCGEPSHAKAEDYGRRCRRAAPCRSLATVTVTVIGDRFEQPGG